MLVKLPNRGREQAAAGSCRAIAVVVTLLTALLIQAMPQAWGREFPPQAAPPKPLALPAPAMRVLPNGLKVLVIERHVLPLITLNLVVRAGAEKDGELPGTAQLVSELLPEGTSHHSAQELAETIDSMGALIDSGAEWDKSYVSLSVLTDHIDLGFELIADIVENPDFAAAETARKKKQTLAALEVVRQDPAYMADTAVRHLLFAGTPYSTPEDGTLESVSKITPEVLRAFHAKYYVPSNAVLAVVGDLGTAEAFERAEKALGSWQGVPGVNTAAAPQSQPLSRQIVAIDKPDAVQTEIRIATSGIPRPSPDYFALTLANEVLGGPAANRLFRALRSHQGLTYSASSDLLCYQPLGGWVIKTSTRTAETVKALRLALEQLENLGARPVSNSELEAAKSHVVGHMPLEFETANDVANEFLELMLHALPLDYWNRFPQEVSALSLDDVWQVARRYADANRCVIVLVGNISGFRRELKKLGPVEIIPLEQVDFNSPSLIRPAEEAGK